MSLPAAVTAPGGLKAKAKRNPQLVVGAGAVAVVVVLALVNKHSAAGSATTPSAGPTAPAGTAGSYDSSMTDFYGSISGQMGNLQNQISSLSAGPSTPVNALLPNPLNPLFPTPIVTDPLAADLQAKANAAQAAKLADLYNRGVANNASMAKANADQAAKVAALHQQGVYNNLNAAQAAKVAALHAQGVANNLKWYGHK